MTEAERAAATVFTSGEHCPMCSAAHGWIGLGRIVYVSSAEQLLGWQKELGLLLPPVRMLPIQDIAPNVVVEGRLRCGSCIGVGMGKHIFIKNAVVETERLARLSQGARRELIQDSPVIPDLVYQAVFTGM